MADKETNLHPKNNTTVNLKPNIVRNNIPDKAVTLEKLDQSLQDHLSFTDVTISLLQTDIAKETSERKNEDKRIEKEANAYADNLSSDLQNQILEVQNHIAEEASTRESEDTRISQEAINYADNLSEGLQNQISSNKSAISSLETRTKNLEDTKVIVNTGTFDPTSDDPASQKVISERTIDLSKIVDSNGHPRFIEGTGSKLSTDTGLTVTYNRWSLSGTHFMWVIAGTVAEDSVIGGQNAPDHNMNFICNIPAWVSNKIVPVFNNRYIAFYSVSFVADNWTTQTKQFVFAKDGTKGLALSIPYGSPDITMDKERHFRVQIDLLIDNAAD